MTLFYRTVCSYIFYTLLVAVGVTFLVLFIQLLERATSAAAPDIGALFWYLLLDSLPTFLKIIPLASWLGMLFVLRDWSLRNEWESLQLLGISIKQLLLMIFSANIFLGLMLIFLISCVGDFLAEQAHFFKKSSIKKQYTTLMRNHIFSLDNNMMSHNVHHQQGSQRFCFIQEYDQDRSAGAGLLLFWTDFHAENSCLRYSFYDTFYHDKEKKMLMSPSNGPISDQALCILDGKSFSENVAWDLIVVQTLILAPLTLFLFTAFYHVTIGRWFVSLFSYVFCLTTLAVSKVLFFLFSFVFFVIIFIKE